MLSIYGNFHLCCLPQAWFCPVTTMLWCLVDISSLWEESCGAPWRSWPWFTSAFVSWHNLCEVQGLNWASHLSVCVLIFHQPVSHCSSLRKPVLENAHSTLWSAQGSLRAPLTGFYVDMLDLISKLWYCIASFSLFCLLNLHSISTCCGIVQSTVLPGTECKQVCFSTCLQIGTVTSLAVQHWISWFRVLSNLARSIILCI